MQPLIPEFDRIAKVQGPTALAEEVARLQMMTGSSVILGALVAPHPQDRTRMAIYLGDASLGLGVDNYLKPDAQRIRGGYVAMITDYLVIAGSKPEAARATAQMVLAVETRVARKKLRPLERRDPAKRFVPMPYADLKRLMSNVDLDAYFRSTAIRRACTGWPRRRNTSRDNSMRSASARATACGSTRTTGPRSGEA